MPRALAAIGIASCLAFFFATSADARRVALVIGNSAYQTGVLANPANDSEAMAAALERLGFEVALKKDLDMSGMRAALGEFGGQANAADMAVVFFAGHGMENGGTNYLIPVDAKLARAADLDLEAIRLATVLEQIDGASKLKLVILDACRNTPFPLAGSKRSQTRGLARVEPENNTLIAYAAKEGTTADDGGSSGHSPFTAALLRHIESPGLEVDYVFRLVRDDVVAVTNKSQTPHLYGTLGRERMFFKGGEPLQAPPSPLLMAQGEAERAWALVQNSDDVAVLEAFRQRHGSDALYDQLAASRIRTINEAKVEAERQRLALLHREAQPQAAPEPARRRSSSKRVKRGVSLGYLNMRTGPGTNYAVVTRVPEGSGGVELSGPCVRPTDGSSRHSFCEVEWRGNRGWLSSNGLE